MTEEIEMFLIIFDHYLKINKDHLFRNIFSTETVQIMEYQRDIFRLAHRHGKQFGVRKINN